jgi:FkbH-like protein
MIEFTSDDKYLTPDDLSVTNSKLRRVLLIGACVTNGWKAVAERSQICTGCDHILFNNVAELPTRPPSRITEYDFQIVALPFRAIIHESTYLRLDYDNIDGHEKLFRDADERLCVLLDAAMRWNKVHGLATFVCNFFVPQQNAMGCLFPRYDIRNPVYFTERLNFRLATELKKYTNTYLLDVDQISASIGRRYIQEDALCVASHNSLLGDYGWSEDQNRLEKPAQPITQVYKTKVDEFIRASWMRLKTDYRALTQEDNVKLIITDLDDTLWRGVIADNDSIVGTEMEGWPIGYAEALAYLKKRGIILGIVSKNEDSFVRDIWPKLLKNRLIIDDFAFVKVNWKTKAENVADIIAIANLLPRNVVFIDDNPVERESVKAAFPDIRVLGSDPYTVKRVLLWSSETQVLSVTDESARRTELMKAQALREEERKSMSRQEFLQSLSVRVRLKSLTSDSDPHFGRVFELLNKTNQFNTTGKRWSQAELLQMIADGAHLLAFFVEDNFSDYGLVGILLISGNHINQYVMSCRVLGMDVELAALITVLNDIKQTGSNAVSAELIETAGNFPARDLYKRAGFEYRDGLWKRYLQDNIVCPEHIDVSWTDESSVVISERSSVKAKIATC